MQRNNEDDGRRTGEGPPRKPGFLTRARARAEREYNLSLSADTPHYAAAALGQSPYVALGNGGVIIVQRKCGSWSC
jgi:hypothetical protein